VLENDYDLLTRTPQETVPGISMVFDNNHFKISPTIEYILVNSLGGYMNIFTRVFRLTCPNADIRIGVEIMGASHT